MKKAAARVVSVPCVDGPWWKGGWDVGPDRCFDDPNRGMAVQVPLESEKLRNLVLNSIRGCSRKQSVP